jgi:SpoIIAA-like
MIYYQDEYVTITWEEAVLCVVAEWRGFIPFEVFTAAMNKNIQLLEEKFASKYVVDITMSGALPPQHAEWVRSDWRPRAVKAGLRKAATVMPESVLAKLVLQDMMKDVPPEWEMKNFDNLDSALKWMR